jgi:hypothetical protein
MTHDRDLSRAALPGERQRARHLQLPLCNTRARVEVRAARRSLRPFSKRPEATRHTSAVKGSARDREDRASRDAGAVEIVAASTVGSRNEAQRAPAWRQGFVAVLRECAQTSFARMAKTPCFLPESFEGDGLKNRCRFERKKLDPASADFTYT